jgi:DNA adenine methylase
VLVEIHERLAGVVIESLPWPNFLQRYDASETLFYLDPPYWGSETDYGAGVFTGSDFARLAVHLGSIKGRFILSVNDVPEMREVFARFSVESVSTRYTIAGGKWAEVAEIVVTGPAPGAVPPAADLLSGI